jgi:PAS domain S-box-containing protein
MPETKKLELALKESEAKYRDLFENANDIIYIHDLKGIILNINKMGSQVLGAPEEEIIGSNIKEWVSPHSLEIFEDRVRKIFLNQPLEQPVVIEVITRKGEHKWGEATTRLIKDGDKIVGVQGIARDITEKRRLEQELKQSEEKYRDLFENAQDAMYVLDDEINFLKMNKIGIETLGCTKEEVIGSNISRWVTPESLRIINERRKKRLSGEKVSTTDILEIVCKNGEHRWVEIRTRVINSNDGRIEYHGIARDITENRLLKQELNKSSKQQKLLCYLIQGTRGGKTRALILKHISDKSYNANQLATALDMDYKTIRHHLNVLIKNGIVGKSNDGYSDLYFVSNNIDLNLNQ